MDKLSKQERLYAEAMGQEALLRQQQLAKDTCNECGYRQAGHHPACKRGRMLAARRERYQDKKKRW